MKQTRKLAISLRVLTSEDLVRIAKVLDEQERPTNDHVSTEYEINFDDNTAIESGSPEVFQNESLTAYGRPVGIRMSFRNYTRDRHISVSLNHGDQTYGNGVIVSGSEPAWVEGSFLALKDRIDKVRPQKSWVRSHPTLLLNLIALGIGSLAVWTIDLVLDLTLTKLKVDEFMPRLPADSPWRRVLSSAEPLLYVLGWIWRWFLGLMWGAHSVRQWLLAMWPSIEFDFGLPTLQTEKIQRRRLYAVYLLVIVPTVTKLLYDLLKRAF